MWGFDPNPEGDIPDALFQQEIGLVEWLRLWVEGQLHQPALPEPWVPWENSGDWRSPTDEEIEVLGRRSSIEGPVLSVGSSEGVTNDCDDRWHAGSQAAVTNIRESPKSVGEVMSEKSLAAETRTITGSGPIGRLRVSGMIPAVICGKGQETVSIQVNHHDISVMFPTRASREESFSLVVDGKPVAVKFHEIQRHKTRNTALHIDFLRV
jgi:ribosomal protein L25 (general stress protein Ctc)